MPCLYRFPVCSVLDHQINIHPKQSQNASLCSVLFLFNYLITSLSKLNIMNNIHLSIFFRWQVQQAWIAYTEKIDKYVEDAFRLNVKWSVQELSRAINGDGKSSPNPLFRLKVVLEGHKVTFSPNLTKLASIINSAAKDLTHCLAVFQRLPNILTRTNSKKAVNILTTHDIHSHESAYFKSTPIFCSTLGR